MLHVGAQAPANSGQGVGHSPQCNIRPNIKILMANNALISSDMLCQVPTMYRTCGDKIQCHYLLKFRLSRSKRSRYIRHTKTRTTENPASQSYTYKNRSGILSVSQNIKLRMKLYILETCIVIFMCSRLFVFVTGAQGICRCVSRNASWPDFVEKRRPIQV